MNCVWESLSVFLHRTVVYNSSLAFRYTAAWFSGRLNVVGMAKISTEREHMMVAWELAILRRSSSILRRLRFVSMRLCGIHTEP